MLNIYIKIILSKLCLATSLLFITTSGYAEDQLPFDDIHYYHQGQLAAKRLQQANGLSDRQIQQAIEGFSSALRGQAPAYTPAEIHQATENYHEHKKARWETLSQKNLLAGEQYLMSLEADPEYHFLDYGLAYKIIRVGEGVLAHQNSQVKLKYIGRHLNGKEFDRSDTPGWLPIQGVLPGWRIALQKMPIGSHWTLIIPPHLAYGERGAADRIGPQETLVYELQLLDVK